MTQSKYFNVAHKRKDQLTVSGEWAKHLRKFLRRHFWKGERKAGKELIRKERRLHIYYFILFLLVSEPRFVMLN
jgi:hypothetical protein